MGVQDVRIEYGLGLAGDVGPDAPGRTPTGLADHFTRIHGSVMIRVTGEGRSDLITVTSEQERLDESFAGLCHALRSTLRTGDGWSPGVVLGIDGPLLILRGSRSRFFKVELREFADQLFGAARRMYDDVRPALGPMARRSMERYLEQIGEMEQEVRTDLGRSEP